MNFIAYDYFLRWHQLLWKKSFSSKIYFIWHYYLLKDFEEVSLIYLFVSNHWELNTMIWIYFLSGLSKETWWIGNPVENPVCVYLGSAFFQIRLTCYDLNSALDSTDGGQDLFLESLIMYSCSKCLVDPFR